jgi:hypothetical protein
LSPAPSIDAAAYPSLARSRAFSQSAIDDISGDLATALVGFEHGIVSVAAAGSLGRLEATPHSDIDGIVIVDGDLDLHSARAITAIRTSLSQFGFRASKADGIYTQPIQLAALLDKDARGSLRESAALFGSRMQLLLDARPLYGATDFDSVRASVLAWYATGGPDEANWTHLFNDLSRYLHSYAVWQQFKFSRSEEDGWYLRQAKLRSTRVVTFAGLMFLVAESSARKTDQSWLATHLSLTPLERMQCVFHAYPNSNFAAVLDDYEELHALLAETQVLQPNFPHGDFLEQLEKFARLFPLVHL